MLDMICLLNTAWKIVCFAVVTLDLYALSRDNYLPFPKWLSQIRPRRHISVNGCIFSCVVAPLLALIYIGSPVSFYAITSLTAVPLLVRTHTTRLSDS